MTNEFELNGKTYKTDEATIAILRQQVAIAKETNDSSAVIAMMTIGEITGSIVEVK